MTSQSTTAFSPFTTALLSGALAGTTVDLSLYPLDTLKTRLQSPTSFLASGGFNGIYAGVGSAIIGSAPGAALFFVTYEKTKAFLSTHRTAYCALSGLRQDESERFAPFEHMVAASLGEIAACAVRVPTEVVKQRAQAQQYASSWAALSSTLQRRSSIGASGVFKEFYRGWGITILREVPFTVIQFPLWEALKVYRLRSTGRTPRSVTDTRSVGITGVESAVAGSVAGAIAAAFTTPLDVLKTRMMLAKEKVPLSAMATTILKENGVRAFFAGIGPRMGWISVGGAIFLGSYQWAYNRMQAFSVEALSSGKSF